jgi:glutamate racemase
MCGAIGVFDSGVGGLSVWREVRALLPDESTIYFADQAHIPYGPRPPVELAHYATSITNLLIELGAKIIVVACNTASGAALETLRATYPTVPFVGMEPAVKPAVEHTRSGVVGVLATPTTFEGVLFRRLVDRFGKDVTIHTQVCPGLVELVEAGHTASAETRELLAGCLAPLLDLGIDQLVLGCTHYPFASTIIADIAGPHVSIIDPAPAVARQVKRLLGAADPTNRPPPPALHAFLTSGSPTRLASQVDQLLGYECQPEGVFWRDNVLRIG